MSRERSKMLWFWSVTKPGIMAREMHTIAGGMCGGKILAEMLASIHSHSVGPGWNLLSVVVAP
jgi:hypothetical protein